jgi:hypothetical protein
MIAAIVRKGELEAKVDGDEETEGKKAQASKMLIGLWFCKRS